MLTRNKIETCHYHFPGGVSISSNGIISCGKKELYIPPKELGVLITLMESSGDIVSKDKIINDVWNNNLVSDESLTRCIYELRKVLDKFGVPRSIDTIYGKGYRFNLQIIREIKEKKSKNKISIALFPFAPSENTREVLTIHRGIIQELSAQHGCEFSMFPVSVTAEVMDSQAIRKFMHQFNPDYYITGRFCSQNDTKYVYVEFINAKSGHLINTKNIKIDPLLKDDADLIHRITNNIGFFLSGVVHAIYPQNKLSPNRLLNVIHGEKALFNFTPDSIDQALSLFFESLHKGENVPECYGYLAECYISLALYGKLDLNKAIKNATSIITRANRVNLIDGRILGILGLLSALKGDRTVADILFRQAHNSSPTSADVFYYHSLFLLIGGDITKAIKYIEMAISYDSTRMKTRMIRECMVRLLHKHNDDCRYIFSSQSVMENLCILMQNITNLVVRHCSVAIPEQEMQVQALLQ